MRRKAEQGYVDTLGGRELNSCEVVAEEMKKKKKKKSSEDRAEQLLQNTVGGSGQPQRLQRCSIEFQRFVTIRDRS